MANPPYTKEEDEMLAKLWNEKPGKSAQQIANILTRNFFVVRTRNSVIGRAHRAGLRKKPSPIKYKPEEPKPLMEMEFKPLNCCAEPKCREKVVKGSYCEHHAAIYYQAPKKKDERPKKFYSGYQKQKYNF